MYDDTADEALDAHLEAQHEDAYDFWALNEEFFEPDPYSGTYSEV